MTSRLCCIALGFATACAGSSSATITLRSGETVRGRIVRSDEATVWIEPDGSWLEENAVDYSIDRDEIVDVSHPGKEGMIAGGVLAGLGALAVAGAQSCRDERESRRSAADYDDRPMMKASCELRWTMVGLWIGIPGVVVLGEGSARYSGSRSRYESSRAGQTRRRTRQATPRTPPMGSAPSPSAPPPVEPSPRTGWCELRGCPR